MHFITVWEILDLETVILFLSLLKQVPYRIGMFCQLGSYLYDAVMF